MFRRPRIIRTAMPIVAVASSLLVGSICTSSASAATTKSPCSLVSQSDVKAAFGGTVEKGKLTKLLSGVATCQFDVLRGNLGVDGTAIVFVTPGQTPASFKFAKSEVSGVVNVPGVGMSAFYSPFTTSIEFLKGSVVANAQGVFTNPGGPKVNAAKEKVDVIALAKAVARHV